MHRVTALQFMAACFFLGSAPVTADEASDKSSRQSAVRRFRLSDSTAHAQMSDEGPDAAVSVASEHFSDTGSFSDTGLHFADEELEEHYPDSVCYHPGRPRLPLWKRPGDINLKDCPPERYCMDDCVRAGEPHCISRWAQCATNEKYSAWYVGGGNSWLLPRYARGRRAEEGTWGLDYDGLFRPRRVWLDWSCGREQGGLGSYATDGGPKFLERFKHE